MHVQPQGAEIFAIGVGGSVDDATLESIASSVENVKRKPARPFRAAGLASRPSNHPGTAMPVLSLMCMRDAFKFTRPQTPVDPDIRLQASMNTPTWWRWRWA